MRSRGQDMKIYLLVLLIGMILTAARATSAPGSQPESIQQ
jgi:hypothetical protein